MACIEIKHRSNVKFWMNFIFLTTGKYNTCKITTSSVLGQLIKVIKTLLLLQVVL